MRLDLIDEKEDEEDHEAGNRDSSRPRALNLELLAEESPEGRHEMSRAVYRAETPLLGQGPNGRAPETQSSTGSADHRPREPVEA